MWMLLSIKYLHEPMCILMIPPQWISVNQLCLLKAQSSCIFLHSIILKVQFDDKKNPRFWSLFILIIGWNVNTSCMPFYTVYLYCLVLAISKLVHFSSKLVIFYVVKAMDSVVNHLREWKCKTLPACRSFSRMRWQHGVLRCPRTNMRTRNSQIWLGNQSAHPGANVSLVRLPSAV